MHRSHTCAQLCKEDIGSEVTLAGWVSNRRDHGGIIFIDLRDRYGLTKVVFDPAHDETAWKIADSFLSICFLLLFVSQCSSSGAAAAVVCRIVVTKNLEEEEEDEERKEREKEAAKVDHRSRGRNLDNILRISS